MASVLQELVDEIDAGESATVSITVVHRGTVHSVGGNEAVVSASAAKLYWAVAAAAQADELGPLERDAEAVFGWSDNHAAGRLIDVAGGVDAVNAYTAALGLADTSLSAWAYGPARFAGDRAERGDLNLTSTVDLARFLDLFAAGALLHPDRQAAVEEWLRLTPDDLASSSGLDGLLTDRLPVSVAAETMHKAGWLPPGCCRAIDHVLTVGGVVPLADDEWFSIAIVAQNSSDFDEAVGWIPQVACEVFRALGGETSCPSVLS